MIERVTTNQAELARASQSPGVSTGVCHPVRGLRGYSSPKRKPRMGRLWKQKRSRQKEGEAPVRTGKPTRLSAADFISKLIGEEVESRVSQLTA